MKTYGSWWSAAWRRAFKDKKWQDSAPNNGVVGTETWAALE